MSVSKTTGAPYYSGDWTAIKDICRTFNIGEGKLAKITEQLVEFYEEMVDREIDGMLERYYYTPILPYNQVMPDGSTKSIYPGNLRRLARYWSAGLLLLSEFQGLEPNVQEASTNYIDESRRMVYDLVRFMRRLPQPGGMYKHNLKTLSPTFAPGQNPEPNF